MDQKIEETKKKMQAEIDKYQAQNSDAKPYFDFMKEISAWLAAKDNR